MMVVLKKYDDDDDDHGNKGEAYNDGGMGQNVMRLVREVG